MKGIVRSKWGLIFGAFLTLFSFFCAATTNMLVKLINHRLEPPQILLCQSTFSLVIISLICLCTHKKMDFFRSRRYGLLFLRSMAGLSAFFLVFLSLRHLSVSVATLLLNTGPLFVPFILWLCFKERIEPKVWLGIVPGFLGILLILKPGAEVIQWSALLGLLSGMSVAVIFTSLRRLHVHGEPMLRILFYLFFFASVVILPFGIYEWKMPSSHDWLLLGLAAMSSFCSQSTVTLAMRYGSPKALAPLCYVSVIFGLLFDWSIWHTIPVGWSLVGMGLVIAGGVTAIVIENRSTRKESK